MQPRGTARQRCSMHAQHLTPQQRFEAMFMGGGTTDGSGLLPIVRSVQSSDSLTLYAEPPHRHHSLQTHHQAHYHYPIFSQAPTFYHPIHLQQSLAVPSNVFVQGYISQYPPTQELSHASIPCRSRPHTIAHHSIFSTETRPRQHFMPKYVHRFQYQPRYSPLRPIYRPPALPNPIQFPSPPRADVFKHCSRQNLEHLQQPTTASSSADVTETVTTSRVHDESEYIIISDQEETTEEIIDPGTESLVSFGYISSSSLQHSEPPQEPSTEPSTSGLEPHTLFYSTKKPPYSISALIGMALKSTPENKMTVKDIYNFISDMFPFYSRTKRAWKNSVRQCLKSSSCFKQITDDSKNVYWMLDPQSNVNFMRGSFQKPKKRKRTQVKHRPPKTSLTGTSLDSIWLLYAEDLCIKTIPNSEVDILELVPPDPLMSDNKMSTTVQIML